MDLDALLNYPDILDLESQDWSQKDFYQQMMTLIYQTDLKDIEQKEIDLHLT